VGEVSAMGRRGCWEYPVAKLGRDWAAAGQRWSGESKQPVRLKICTTISAQSIETNSFQRGKGNIHGQTLFCVSCRGGRDL